MPIHSIEEICGRLNASKEVRFAVASGHHYTTLLPLLEHPLHEVEFLLQASLVEAGMDARETDCVSLEKLVIFALSSWGSYWPELAVVWLEGGFPINESLARRLEIMSQEENLPQTVRHRAFTLVKRWRRTQEHPEVK